MGSLFCFYFSGIFYYQILFLKRTQYAMSTADILWTSSYSIKGAVLFTQESILQERSYKNVSVFRNMIYEESNKLDKIIDHDFPKEFDPFVHYMKAVSVSMCSRASRGDPCHDSQYLVKGLKTIVVKIAENTREIMKELTKQRRAKN
jgi:hypothetical protein